MKPNINSLEVHPQRSNKGHPVDGALVGVGSLWPSRSPNLTFPGLNISSHQKVSLSKVKGNSVGAGSH